MAQRNAIAQPIFATAQRHRFCIRSSGSSWHALRETARVGATARVVIALKAEGKFLGSYPVAGPAEVRNFGYPCGKGEPKQWGFLSHGAAPMLVRQQRIGVAG